jgi:hypothetical protein
MLAGSMTIDAMPLTWYFANKSVVHGQAVPDREEA